MSNYKKVELEYILRCSAPVLYTFLSTPSGLSEWFCDNVNIKNNNYFFFWNGGEEQAAQVVSKKENVFIRYRWEDDPKEKFLEFRIEIDDITQEVALIITDFAEEGEEEEIRLYWDNEITSLHRVIGA
ncbi:MAG: START-like domain-containing protein [Flavobacteriales bacterium]